jgi:hypothetical protein
VKCIGPIGFILFILLSFLGCATALDHQWQKAVLDKPPQQYPPPVEKTENPITALPTLEKMKVMDPQGRLDVLIDQMARKSVPKVILLHHHTRSYSIPTHESFLSFFGFTDFQKVHFFRLSKELVLKTKNQRLKIPQESYWITAEQHPCSNNRATVFINPEALSQQQGFIRFKQGGDWVKFKAHEIKPHIYCIDL